MRAARVTSNALVVDADDAQALNNTTPGIEEKFPRERLPVITKPRKERSKVSDDGYGE